jgi:hypothetical protein
MKQQGQEVEGNEERGEMLLAMSKIMFEVVALGFEGIVILVFGGVSNVWS